MMIFQDYTEYLVRHKLYREALAAGRKTMPVSKSKENILQPKSVESQLKPQEPEPVATEIGKKKHNYEILSLSQSTSHIYHIAQMLMIYKKNKVF